MAWAQEPAAPKPPAGVEEALRARIQEFYHYFETQEYRKAEKLVAEDSQDFFYNHNKPHYLSVDIQNIKFSPDYKQATVVLLCEQFIMMPGFAGKPMKVPTTSTWKIVDGQWFWYVDPIESRRTPFGLIPERKDAGAPSGGLPASIPTTPDFALNLVKPDTKSVELTAGGSGQVTFTNTARGLMMLSVAETPDGVEATLDRGQVNAGEKAVLTVKAQKNARAGHVLVKIMPTDETIAVAVAVK
jgi:hypothetical protein